MNIPFIADIGMEKQDNGLLYLPFTDMLLNHIGTIHASAQFTLAETQSGFYLLEMFPQYEGKFIPLLRSSTVKYKNPATKDIYAKASASKESLEKFETQFLKRGRASITVNVNVFDSNNTLIMIGEFVWFVQNL